MDIFWGQRLQRIGLQLQPYNSFSIMLRSFQRQKQVAQPFVCFHCLARNHHNSSSNTSRRPRSRSQSKAPENGRSREIRRQLHAGRVARSSIEAQTVGSLPQEPPPPLSTSRPSIRQRLRQWEMENAVSYENPGFVIDKATHGNVSNEVLQVSYNDFSGEDVEPKSEVEEHIGLDFERFDMVDVGDSRSFLLPGDLVELTSTGNRRQELGIYVRELDPQAQFYTMSGRWIHRSTKNITFFVPGFVDGQELDEIRPFLPEEAVDMSMEGKLQSFNESVPVGIGQPLIRKMLEFWNKADSTYQRAATDLDGAHRAVADIFHYKYATLEEIAGKVLPKGTPKNEDGKHEWPALYAVHRALLKDDIGFTPASLTAMRSNPRYEINGFSEVDCIRRVVGWVRKYTDTLLGQAVVSRAPSPGYTQFMDFIKTARRLIDLSRANREYTTHGTIGPSLITLEPGQNFRQGTSRETFSTSDTFFIRFLESWSCLRSFGPHSGLHGIGSTILRMIDRYHDGPLNTTTAWTCLKELGALPPWEIGSTFDLRLPYVGRQDAIMRRLHPSANSSGGVVKDKLAAIRQKWGKATIYCVDDAVAHEIDDGFSLEATDVPGVYWVHVHIADPAAHLDPRGLISEFAERVTETIYLPDRVVPMLPPTYTQAHYSLGPGRPCLTFSTKTNMQGEMLDSRITAGIVENVKYLTKETFNEVTTGSNPVEYDFYVVGSQKAEPPMTRPLLNSTQFSEKEKEDLRILQSLGEARREKLQARGGVFAGQPAPTISMSFNGFPWTKPKNFTDSMQYFGDPTISVGIEKQVAGRLLKFQEVDTVGNLMIMTGETAARWCCERNIPIPYRITPRNPDKQDPSEYFQRVVVPAQGQPGGVSAETMRNYFALIGKVQPSSIPGPHVALGVDMFAKVTSPLRRFGDLIAHWQIEAALLQENKTGESLAGKSNVDFLPFTRAQLDDILPQMASRERLIATQSRRAERMVQLQFVLRAWKFGEAKLPNTLEFTVRSINPDTNAIGGLVNSLLLGGQMSPPPEINIADINVGDRFEVEISDIDVSQSKLFFKCIRQIESESELAAKERVLQETSYPSTLED
ncbi:hypothetical protein BKA65DRAFT_532959 [Rhexocercosporidium sp. MPI-PUGE-AT-0058]|nr:hypothetical protein BKA65DRAFT_532959 [Rhexocercosporidium sp. MPI-PUGE-AT-0058]